MKKFGELNQVALREIWPNEATDFTPWLAENIEALGETLGIDLELKSREADVGDFSLDLLATDLGTKSTVVIENQITPTNHDHLGKVITYASGFDASIVVWIAEQFREEHRQAIDWLNQRTDSDTQFFGVIIQVLQIDDSKPAFNFLPVAYPNEWRKDQRRITSESVSPKGEAYRRFFQALIDELRERHSFTRARRGQAQSWYLFSSGIQGLYYDASSALGDRIRVGIYIDIGKRDDNKKLFDHLTTIRESIEAEFGNQLEWERLDDKKSSKVALYRNGNILMSESELKEIREWMIQGLFKSKKVFIPRIKNFLKGEGVV